MMLALKALADETKPPEAVVMFPWWLALRVVSNREEKSAKWLKRNVKIVSYWPCFYKKVRCRGGFNHHHRPSAVLPGLLFVPSDIMEIDRRDKALKEAQSHGFLRSMGHPATLSKAEIEIIREIEAKLNLPPEANGVLFKIGQRVRFTNELYAAFWGTGIVFEVASQSRIGIEVEKVIGGPTKVYVPASEIEAM